ncbi:MAG TPA: DUF1566 domain-containing protein [Thermoanaerobaculia bacterium]|nr:DUF1566 domain-containing protein [Thermoanaerobaculia bacterium]
MLLVSSDMDCRLELDGEPLGDLRKDVVQEFRVRPGEHLLQAFPDEIEGPVWKETVNAPDTGSVVTTVELREVVDDWREQMANVERFTVHPDHVVDNTTGLMWTRTATPDMRWDDIGGYCSKLRAGGFSGWRLPSLDEVSKLYWPDHPSPPQETFRETGEWTIFGRKRGEIQVLPRHIFEPFDQSSVDAVWVSGAEPRIACSFLGEFTCSIGGKKAQASTFCVRRAQQ